MFSLWAKYSEWLVTSPLVSRAATSFVLFGLGDFLCQTMVEKRGALGDKAYNFVRTARMSCIGGFIAGPIIWGWLNFALPAIAGLPFLKTAGHWPQTAVCLLADQTVWAYSFNAFMLF